MNDQSISIATFGEMVSGNDDIAQSWYNILHTVPGSDPLRPNFGSDLYKYLDVSTGGVSGDFTAQIISDLERWESRAEIKRITKRIGDSKIILSIEGLYTETESPVIATIDITDLATSDLTEIQRAYSDAYNDLAYS